MSSPGVDPEPSSVAARRLLQIVETRFADGLSAARAATAAGPGADAQTTRSAYLDLLKLALADLIATSTSSVARTQHGEVMSRELTGEDLKLRAAGLDWPLHALTMLGLARLDDLQACVERIVADKVPGDLIEAGSWRGGAAMLMRATLDTLGQRDRTVWVADSFQGFPAAPNRANDDGYSLWSDLAGADFLAVPLEEVQASFARLGLNEGVNFVPGFFQDTLPPLHDRIWSLVRLDGDTYESVRAGLDSLYPGLSVGGYLVIDDYNSLDQCREAVQDYRREHGIEEPIEEIDWNGARWRREQPQATPTTSPRTSSRPASLRRTPSDLRPVERGPRKRVPAMAEVELREELARVQARLHQTQATIARVERAPLAGLKLWVQALLRQTRGPRGQA